MTDMTDTRSRTDGRNDASLDHARMHPESIDIDPRVKQLLKETCGVLLSYNDIRWYERAEMPYSEQSDASMTIHKPLLDTSPDDCVTILVETALETVFSAINQGTRGIQFRLCDYAIQHDLECSHDEPCQLCRENPNSCTIFNAYLDPDRYADSDMDLASLVARFLVRVADSPDVTLSDEDTRDAGIEQDVSGEEEEYEEGEADDHSGDYAPGRQRTTRRRRPRRQPSALQGPAPSIPAHLPHIVRHDQVFRQEPHARVSLPACDITVTEFCWALPNHIRHPELVFRLISNGWLQGDLAPYMLYWRGISSRRELVKLTNTLCVQIQNAMRRMTGNTAWTRAADAHALRPTSQYGTAHFSLGPSRVRSSASPSDYPLHLLASTSTRTPSHPEDVGVLTACILYAKANPHLPLMISDIPQLVQTHGFQSVQPPQGENLDVRALQRWRNIRNTLT